MNKEERIKRYGEAAYEKKLQQRRDWHVQHCEKENNVSRRWAAQHREEANTRALKWVIANPEKAKANKQQSSCKGGKYYEKRLEYNRTGLQGERERIRKKHTKLYYAIKQATPNSQIHHEWISGTAGYRGVALVDKEAHRHGIIKVIKILEGAITLFTEKEIKRGFKNGKK